MVGSDGRHAARQSGQFGHFDYISLVAQRVHEPVDLFTVARLAFDFRRQAFGRQCGENALVIDFDDVDVVFVELAHDLEQCARSVLQHDLQASKTPGSRKVAQEHIG